MVHQSLNMKKNNKQYEDMCIVVVVVVVVVSFIIAILIGKQAEFEMGVAIKLGAPEISMLMSNNFV